MAALGATLLVSLAVPAADAWMPQASRYRPGAAITLDTNLLTASGASAWAINEYLQSSTSLPPLGSAFIAAEQKYGVNARFLLAAALHESGWGTSDIARFKHNLFGYNAYDRDPYRYATAFASYAANIDATAKFIHDFYLTPSGRWWGGQPTLRSMQQYWSSSHRWGLSVSNVANSIRLDAFDGSALSVATPVVTQRLHAGDEASVLVAWKGGDLPAGIEFVATWAPVALDADVIAGASGAAPSASGVAYSAPLASSPDALSASASAVGGPGATPATPGAIAPIPSPITAGSDVAAPSVSANRPPVTVEAQRERTDSHAVTLSVAAPLQPGQYQLSLELRDTGGTPLPKTEQVKVPSTAVRVWADESVSLDLAASADGTGAVLRLTNTGVQPIAAQPALDPLGPNDPESRASTSLNVTATTADAANPTPVVLLTAPLTTDLEPGASLTFPVPAIEASTGRVGNWLSATLNVPGSPAWVSAYAPIGAWFANGAVSATVPASALAPSSVALLVGPVLPQTANASATPPATAPTAAPTASTAPRPRPTSMPSSMPAPKPSSMPAPKPTPPAVKHGTQTFSEHSAAVTYQGRWQDAGSPSYQGGNVSWSTTPGSSATISFVGNSVTWIGPMGPTRGRALVLIDGHAVTTVNLWRSGFVPQVALFAHSFGSVGPHTLTIEVLSSPGHPFVAIDGFVVRS